MSQVTCRTRWRTPFDPLVKSNLESVLVVCHVSFSIGSRFKVQRFGGSHAHFEVTRPAEGSACDGDGKGKQGKQGKGKEKVM
jgi:hypothetical protein